MSYVDIANVLGVSEFFVTMVLRSYRNAGFRWPLPAPPLTKRIKYKYSE
jgi:transposase